MKYYINLIILVCISFQILSCTANDSASKLSKDKISKDSNSTNGSAYSPEVSNRDDVMSQIAKSLDLGDMKTNSNEEEIRIWFSCVLEKTKIVVLKKNENKWHSSAHYFKMPNEKGNFIPIEKESEENEPASGWAFMAKEVNEFAKHVPENSSKINDYSSCADGDVLIIELWRNNSYKNYFFNCYDGYWDKLPEMSYVWKFCLLIEKEFKYKASCTN